MKNYNGNVEKNLLDMVKQKEQNDRRLLSLEILIGIFSIIILFHLQNILRGTCQVWS